MALRGPGSPFINLGFQGPFSHKNRQMTLKKKKQQTHKSAQHGSGSGVCRVLFQQRFPTPNLNPEVHNTSVSRAALWDGFSLLGTGIIPGFSCRAGLEGAGRTQEPCWLPRHVRFIWSRGSRALPARKSGVFAVQPCYLQLSSGAGTAPRPPLPWLFPEGPDPGDSHPAPFWEQRWVWG